MSVVRMIADRVDDYSIAASANNTYLFGVVISE